MLMYYAHDETRMLHPVGKPTHEGDQVILSEEFTRQDAKLLVETLGLSEHLLSDVFDINELPRVEVEGDYQYIFLRNAEPNKGKTASHPILFIIGKNLLACLSSEKQSTAGLIAISETTRSHSLQRMLIGGVMAVAKNYEKIIDHIGDKILSVERRMRSHEANNKDFYSFVSIETGLSRVKMSLVGLSTVVEKILPDTKSKAEHELFDDILLFSKQLHVEVESHLQTIKSIREAYSTVVNNTLNQRMKVLTALTLLLALPNVFYSMYGMNLPLPFMNEPWAYGVVVGFTVLLVVAVYLLARHKKFF